MAQQESFGNVDTKTIDEVGVDSLVTLDFEPSSEADIELSSVFVRALGRVSAQEAIGATGSVDINGVSNAFDSAI